MATTPHTPGPQGGRLGVNTPWLLAVAIGAFAVVAVMLVAVWFNRADAGPLEPGPVSGTLALGSVLDDPEQYYGRTVTVAGLAVDLISPRAFTIRDPANPLGEELLVLDPAPDPYNPWESDIATMEDGVIGVTGVLTRLDRTALSGELEREMLPSMWLEGDIFDEFEDRPVLIAEEFNVAPTQYRGESDLVEGDPEILDDRLVPQNEDIGPGGE